SDLRCILRIAVGIKLAVAGIAPPTQRHAFLAPKLRPLGGEQCFAAGRAVAKSHEASIDIEASAHHPGTLFTGTRIRVLCEAAMTSERMESGLSVASPVKITRRSRGAGAGQSSAVRCHKIAM